MPGPAFPNRLNVLYATPIHPAHMPPLEVSARQVTVGPFFASEARDGLIKSIAVPLGAYDLGEVVSALPADQRPDLVIALVDSSCLALPTNLRSISARKILLLGDTHHGRWALQRVLSFARQEEFDRFASIHDPHHVHWFAEAGLSPLAYLPNFNAQDFDVPFTKRREPAIVFVGQTGFHPRRRRLLDVIAGAGFPLLSTTTTPAKAAEHFSRFQISFNCSLNGDLNMRVFEVLAAGGFLVTDKLSSQSGLDRMFRPGKHYVEYSDADDLVEILSYFLPRPDECLKIAKAGQLEYQRTQSAELRRDALLRFALKGEQLAFRHDRRAAAKGEGFGSELDERVLLYEFVQEAARASELVVVGLDAALGPRVISDFADLTRLRLRVMASEAEWRELAPHLESLGVAGRVEMAGQEPFPCDIMILRQATIARGANVGGSRIGWLAVMGPKDERGAVVPHLGRQGYFAFTGTDWLFRRPDADQLSGMWQGEAG